MMIGLVKSLYCAASIACQRGVAVDPYEGRTTLPNSIFLPLMRCLPASATIHGISSLPVWVVWGVIPCMLHWKLSAATPLATTAIFPPPFEVGEPMITTG